MSRTVAALYDSRAEAEFARARLVSRLKAKSPRIISKDTVAALDTLDIASADKDSYREQLRGGGHLLVAEAPIGADAKRIIELLEEAVGHADPRADQQWGDSTHGVRVELPGDQLADSWRQAPSAEADEGPWAPDEASAEAANEPSDAPVERHGESTPLRERRGPWFEQELRRGKTEPPPAEARVRSFTHDAPAEEQVALVDEVVAVENRPSERTLSDSEMDAGGLFQERVFEIAEMREEPVVTKVAVVREEVIVRKILRERTETIRDTVRQTQIEVEDFTAAEESDPVFFARNPTK